MELKTPIGQRIFFLVFFGIISGQNIYNFINHKSGNIMIGIICGILSIVCIVYERKIVIVDNKVKLFSPFSHRTLATIPIASISAIIRFTSNDGDNGYQLLLQDGKLLPYATKFRFLEVCDKQDRDLRQILNEDYGIVERTKQSLRKPSEGDGTR